MSARRDPIFTFAVCASLVAHTAILLILAGQFVDSLPPLSFGPLRTNQSPAATAMLVIQPPARPPPPPSYLLFGEAKGTGDAANASPGDEPMRGRDGGQVQAYLSRDPVGPSASEEAPSMSVLPRGASVPPAMASPAELEPPSPPDPPESLEPPLKVIGVSDGASSWSPPRVPRTHPPRPPAVPAPPTDQIGSAAPPADAAIMSDSESDAFAKGGSVEFVDGRVDVRFGRKVKTVRPQLSFAARYDLMGMAVPRMVVRVKVDAAGNVRLVDIVKSTGSDSADQAVKVALYQWWFEPPKDKSGATLGDVVEFPIVWR